MPLELKDHSADQEAKDSTDTLLLAGGVALVVFGAGLILSTPFVRGLLGGVNIGNLVGSAVPKDFERYMKLRSM